MSISFIGASSANGTTLTLPSHQAGDILVLAVFRHNSTGIPTIPLYFNGYPFWNQVAISGNNTSWLGLYWKIASSSMHTSGTWTNATQLACCVYRGSFFTNGNAQVNSPATGTSFIYSQVSGGVPFSSRNTFYIGVGASRHSDTDAHVAPSGMTNRTSTAGTTGGLNGKLAIHDTNGAVASWSTTNVTNTGDTSSVVKTQVFELFYVDDLDSGGGSGTRSPFAAPAVFGA